MDLLSHRAKEHHDQEDACNIQLQSTPKAGKENTDLELDELLLEGYLQSQERFYIEGQE